MHHGLGLLHDLHEASDAITRHVVNVGERCLLVVVTLSRYLVSGSELEGRLQ